MAIIYERDDAPYRLDTPYTMELGDTFPGTLTNNDLDLVWTELTAGTTYEFSLTGRGQGDRLDDPSLNLWDSSSNPVASNDNRAPDDLSSLIKFTPETSGSYYIGIWSTNSESGDYELQVSEGAIPILTSPLMMKSPISSPTVSGNGRILCAILSTLSPAAHWTSTSPP